MRPVWYVAYGTNLSSARFAVYLRGGRPTGGARDYPGARDPVPPRADVALTIPGGIRFIGTSSVWGGGMAIYDADADGDVAARGYLVTSEQFIDVLAQEMHLAPTLDLDLAVVAETGWHSIGAGRYQTIASLGLRDGHPMLTFTSADIEDHPVNPPSPSYLRTMAVGLREAHGWDAERTASYLLGCPGVAGAWAREDIARLAA